jgi:hypothetical protein
MKMKFEKKYLIYVGIGVAAYVAYQMYVKKKGGESKTEGDAA